MSGGVTWDEQVTWEEPGPPVRATLRYVRLGEVGEELFVRAATLADLRKACEVVAGYQFSDWEAVHAICDEQGVSRETMGLDAQMMRPALARERVRALVVKLAEGSLAAEKARAEKAEEWIAAAEARAGVSLPAMSSAYAFACERLGVKADNLGLGVARVLHERDEARQEVTGLRAELGKLADTHAATIRATGDTIADLRARLSEAEERLSALTAPVEGEPTEEKVLARWYAEAGTSDLAVAQFAIAHWRAGYAACAARHADSEGAFLAVRYALRDIHDADDLPMVGDVERLVRELGVRAEKSEGDSDARHQPTEPRATDAELLAAYDEDFSLRAVYDLGRRKRPACLVERAVAHARDGLAGHEGDGDGLRITWDIVSEQWTIRVASRARYGIETERVRATLEAMLTEVGA